MKNSQLSKMVAQNIWDHRNELEIKIEHSNEMMQHQHPVELILPSGMRVSIGYRDAVVDTGHNKTTLDAYDMWKIRSIWRAIFLEKLLRKMGDTRSQAELEIAAYKVGQKLLAKMGRRPVVDIARAMEEAAEEKICKQIASGAYGRSDDHEKRVWYHIGNEIRLSHGKDKWQEVDLVYIHHPEFGTTIIDGKQIRKVLKRREMMATAAVLESQPIPMLPSGNARLSRIAELCQEAVLLDPEMCDTNGTPIRPLVERHLPELASRHALAARSADVKDLAGIDAELEDGVEGVRKAVEEALAFHADQQRENLSEQLRFLKSRHPEKI